MEENKNNELNEIEETIENEELTENVNDVEEEKDNTVENNVEPKQKGNKLRFIILGLLGVAVLAAIIFLVMSYITTPKNTFFRVVKNSWSQGGKSISEFGDSVFGQILTLDTSSKITVDANIKGDIETEDANTNEWFSGLKSFEVTAKEEMDISNDYTNTAANFSLNGEKFLAGNLIKNKNITSLKLDDITNGYITVDENNLSALWTKLGYNGPNSLDNSIDILKELNFSKQDYKDLNEALEKFGSGFSSVFDDEDFSKAEAVVTHAEGEIECESVDLLVTAIDFNNAIIAGLDEVIAEERYIDAFYKVISTLDKLGGYEPFTREEFGANLKGMADQIRSLEISEEEQDFVIRIYYKGNDMLKLEIRSALYYGVFWEFTCVDNEGSKYYKLADGMTIYTDKVTTEGKVTTHSMTVDHIDYETGIPLEGYGSEVTIKIDNSVNNKQTVNYIEKVRLMAYDENNELLDVMDVEPTVVKDYTLKGTIVGDNNNIEITMIDSDNSYSSTFTVNADIKENAEFEYASISENFDVEKKTDDEITTKKNEVVSAWNTTLGSNKNKFEQFETAVLTYLSIFMPVADWSL